MKNFKQIRNTMTEQALSIECVMRGHRRVELRQIADACQLRETVVEFILAQMESCGVVHRVAFGRYSLTPAYLAAYLSE
ncbi:hypothetical protein CBJ37_21375 [Salmonella enterica subsp. enterica serovar Durham]|nr:hypothetical protein [Salmonella enterica subsp. enterica serovar Telelkebir]EEI9693363.1 hypothetical protein [Salmonella enterica subsp. enterica serovar Hillingdon]EEM8331918.1 hypothetical protein [Salmonella enterica subsp. enterica serovar Durham]